MISWKNLDTLDSFKALKNFKETDLKEALGGAHGAERVKKYSVPMAEGLKVNYAAKKVDDDILNGLKELAKEAELADKFTRNEIASSNEIRSVIGWKPSDDPKADMLVNANLNQSPDEMGQHGEGAPEEQQGDRFDEAGKSLVSKFGQQKIE